MRRTSAVLAIAALAALGIAACGGGDDDDTTAAAPATTAPATGGSTVDIATPPGSDLAYEQTEVSAKAGNVTIDFNNQQSTEHDVKVEDSAGQELGGTDLVASGAATSTINLQPGSYTFFCSVAGHRESGMEGTLAVK